MKVTYSQGRVQGGAQQDRAPPKFFFFLTLKVLVATIDALGHFETG